MIRFLFETITLLPSLYKWLYAFGLVFSILFLIKAYATKEWQHKITNWVFGAWALGLVSFLGTYVFLKSPSAYEAGLCFRKTFSEEESKLLTKTRTDLKMPLKDLPQPLVFARYELLKNRVRRIHNRAKQIIVISQEGKHNFFVEKQALESWDDAQIGVDFTLSSLELESVDCSESAIFVMNSITLPQSLKQILLSKHKESIHLGPKPASLE